MLLSIVNFCETHYFGCARLHRFKELCRRSWQSGRFLHQRSTTRIQSTSIFTKDMHVGLSDWNLALLIIAIVVQQSK